MDMQNIVQQTQTGAGGKKLHVTLSPAAASLVAVGIVLVLGWCFYMGFMIGRGQNPEEHLQKIAALWQQEAGDKGQPAQSGQPGTPGQPGQTGQAQPGQEGAAQPAAGAEGAAAEGQPAQPGAQQDFVSGTVPGFPTFTTPGQPAQVQAQSQARAQAQPEKQVRADEPYTFVYRMATVRSQSDARSEQARYESKGFRVSIRRLGSSWALQYTFKGTDEDCARFLQSVKKAGLGEPMRISRKKN